MSVCIHARQNSNFHSFWYTICHCFWLISVHVNIPVFRISGPEWQARKDTVLTNLYKSVSGYPGPNRTPGKTQYWLICIYLFQDIRARMAGPESPGNPRTCRDFRASPELKALRWSTVLVFHKFCACCMRLRVLCMARRYRTDIVTCFDWSWCVVMCLLAWLLV
jgi:hypothetical protein